MTPRSAALTLAAAPTLTLDDKQTASDVCDVAGSSRKLDGSLSRLDSTRGDPQSVAETQELPADTRIRPAAARARSDFASRRSPVRSRLAPYLKSLEIARFETSIGRRTTLSLRHSKALSPEIEGEPTRVEVAAKSLANQLGHGSPKHMQLCMIRCRYVQDDSDSGP
jgi:hypothetical protein